MSEDTKWKIFRCTHCDKMVRMRVIEMIDIKEVSGELVHSVCGNEVEDITEQLSSTPGDCYEGVAQHLGK